MERNIVLLDISLMFICLGFLGKEFKESELAVITNTDMDYRDETISLNDSQDRTLVLRIKYSDILENGGRKVSIYSPYVLLNKTGLDMLYSARSIVATTRLAAGQGKKT